MGRYLGKTFGKHDPAASGYLIRSIYVYPYDSR